MTPLATTHISQNLSKIPAIPPPTPWACFLSFFFPFLYLAETSTAMAARAHQISSYTLKVRNKNDATGIMDFGVTPQGMEVQPNRNVRIKNAPLH